MAHPNSSWQIWIDTGGTFTDCLALDSEGRLHRAKVLSNSALRGFIEKQLEPSRFRINEKWSVPSAFINGFRFRILEKDHPQTKVKKFDANTQSIELDKSLDFEIAAGCSFEVISPEEAPILAARIVTGTLPDQSLPNINMRLATTRGTNALLERKGVPVALFITKGFGDLLRIGNQQRPDLFALEIIKPAPLYETVIEVDERLSSDGAVLKPLHLNPMDSVVAELQKEGVRAAAIALMHSYLNPKHERELSDYLVQKGFETISSSAELAPFIKIVPRAETAVVDAYLAPVIESYLQKVRSSLRNGRLHVMTSAGGLEPAESYHAKESLLSGPAGGVVGAALSGKRSGFDKIIAFDMGGTSTDVARYDGDYEYVFEHEVGDAHLVGNALSIESVAAGGGSICSFDGFRLRVGPESAGAEPGPACYGAGGPLTLSDVNLLLGRIDPDRFEIPILKNAAEEKIEELRNLIADATPAEKLLQGFLDIANERMADAIRKVSIRKGYDPQEYALVAFGGAGGQHACGVAERLGIKTVIIPQDASLLSAYGLGHAVLERFAEKQILQRLDKIESQVPHLLGELVGDALVAVAAEGIPKGEITIRRRIVNLRFVGQDSALSVEYNEGVTLWQAFETQYHEIFGHLPEGRDIEVESMRVVCSTQPPGDVDKSVDAQNFAAHPDGNLRAYFEGEWQDASLYERSHLKPGAQIPGPALVFEQHSATVIEAGWNAKIDGADAIVLEKT